MSNARNATKPATMTHQPTPHGANRYATNCPATSSTTTAPGSFFPNNFSARVAAHVPTIGTTQKTRSTGVVYGCPGSHLGRLRPHSSLPEQVRFFGSALEQHAYGLADARAVLPERDARLLFHQTCAATLRHTGVNLAGQVEGGRALFVRVGEDADAVDRKSV